MSRTIPEELPFKAENNSKQNFRIREVTTKDLSRILEIRRASLIEESEFFGFHEEGFVMMFLGYRLLNFIERLRGKRYTWLFVAEVLGDVAGTVILSNDGHAWHISGVMVDPKFRRKGYGKRLVSKACEEAKRRGAEKIYLKVLEKNVPARTLYHSLQFEDFERKLYFYKDWNDRDPDGIVKRILPPRCKVVRLRDPMFFKLHAWVFRQDISEKFAIIDDREKTIGKLELHAGSRRKVVTLSLNLDRRYRRAELEESLLAMVFERARKKGADRLLVEVDDMNQELQEVYNRLNLKLLFALCSMFRNLGSNARRS